MHRTNSKAKKWLSERGYIIYVCPHTRFQKDAFGIADMIALKDGKVWFIQVKTNSSGMKDIYREFCDKYKVNIMLIVFKDRKKIPYVEVWELPNY